MNVMEHTKAWGRRADLVVETVLTFLGFYVISIFYCVSVRPFMGLLGLFRRNTERFTTLATLRLDALCRELVEGKDFYPGPDNRNRMTDWELQFIANHICEKCALGAVDNKHAAGASDPVRSDGYYPEVFEIFAERYFWRHVYGNGVDAMHVGVAVGFYSGVALSGLIFWLVTYLS